MVQKLRGHLGPCLCRNHLPGTLESTFTKHQLDRFSADNSFSHNGTPSYSAQKDVGTLARVFAEYQVKYFIQRCACPYVRFRTRPQPPIWHRNYAGTLVEIIHP